MKKLFKATFAIALSSMLLFSCSKAEQVTAPDDSNLVKVTLIAGNPQVNPGTKTEISGTTPYWSVGDVIGVSDGTSSNSPFSTSITSASKTAEFTGTTVSGDLYAYYPFDSHGFSNATPGIRVDLPADQNPTVTSFDGSADVMVSKMFSVNPDNTTVSGLQFKRLGAIVKIVLKDNDNLLSGEHPSTVGMEAESNLIGTVRVLFAEQSLSELQTTPAPSKKVTANYTPSTHFEIDGTNAAYLIVYPQTLAAGTTLIITASTEHYSIEKEITIPSGGINLTAGKITTLNIGLNSAHLTPSSTGLALPFEDDMAWADNGSSDSPTALQVSDLPSNISGDPLYSAISTSYKGAGGLKLGSSSAKGSITTSELNLSSAFYVEVNAKTYGSDVSTLHCYIDGVEHTTSYTLSSSYETYYFNSSAATAKSKVEFKIDGKRGYLNGVSIKTGTHVFPPVINVTTTTPIEVAKTASTGNVIAYTIDNPVTGVSLTASSTDSWISNIAVASGQVTFNVAANTGSARSGVITLKYTGAPDVDVIVNQESSVATNTYEYLFNSKSWGATRDGVAENWVSGKDGNSLLSGQGIQVTTGATGANGTSPFSFTGVEEIVVTYCTNATSGSGSIDVSVGSGAEKSFTVTKPSSGGTTLKTAIFNYSVAESGEVNLNVNCTANSIYIYSVSIKAASIVLPTYYDIVCNSTTNGTISTDVNKAIEGQEVTITAEPNTGYILSSLSVIGESSTSYTVTNSKFTMPAEKVYISATFTEGSAGGTVTFTPGTDSGATSVTKGGVTVTMTTMNNASYYQVYANQSMTVSVPSGFNITKIEFSCTASGTSKYGPGNASSEVGTYSYSGSTGTWTGSKNSVTISSTAQIRMTTLSVTYE